MPSFPTLDAPLSGERVALRFEAERDIPEVLIAHQEDPALFIRLGLDRPPSGAELGRRIEAADARRADGSGVRFTIVESGDDTCRGQIDVHRVDWDHLRAEAGIWVVPGHRGRGLGSAALRVLAHWLFDRCGLQRLELLTEPDNARMIGAARRAGFVEEGVLRAYVRERGARLDVTVLSLLPADLVTP
jgi:RimJ/RimL family protein N-acetyltransferase